MPNHVHRNEDIEEHIRQSMDFTGHVIRGVVSGQKMAVKNKIVV